jgi:ABC-type phosphate transport system auxiliary subunit
MNMPAINTPRIGPRERTRVRGGTSLLAQGESMLWLTGGALAVCSVMIVGFLALVLVKGTATFWPQPVVEVAPTTDACYGEVTRTERSPTPQAVGSARARYQKESAAHDGVDARLLRTGN